MNKHFNATHGRSKDRVYKIWKGIRTRCLNKNNPRYKYYGGRGIIICTRWDDFVFFLEDMGEPPTKRHEIDRINNNGNYEPNNCRWVLPKYNARNQSTSKRWIIDGVEYESAMQAAKKLGKAVGTIKNWCDGYVNPSGSIRPPRENCYSYKVYGS